MDLTLPRRLNLVSLPWILEHWPPTSGHVTIHFHRDQRVEPAGMVGLACLIDRHTRGGGVVALNHADCSTIGYWERMGFFDQLGHPSPAPSGQRRASARRFSEMKKVEEIDLVDGLTNELVSVVSPQGDALRVLSHVVSEALNNICQHSEAYGFSSAQYWAGTEQAEFCIADGGRGLFEALTPRYQPKNDTEAVELALKVGITSRPPSRGQTAMRNRGVGLTCIHRLIESNGGQFCLWSGKGQFTSALGRQTLEQSTFSWPGTLITVKMPRGNLTASFQDVMGPLSEELHRVEKGTR